MRYFVDWHEGSNVHKSEELPYAQACGLARRMSKKHGSAYVLARDEGKRHTVGSIGYFDGVRDTAGIDGRVK